MPEENKNEQPISNPNTVQPDPPAVSASESSPVQAAADTPQQPAASQAQPVVGSQINNSKKSKLPLFVAIVLAIIALSLGVVFGYVIPNQPENVFKAAIANTAQQTKGKFEGKYSLEFLDESSPVKAMNVEMSGQSDTENKASEISMKFTATGVSVPFDLRHVENNLYFKLGDISTIKSLAKSAAPEYAGMIDQVNKLIADQWIEVDETLLKQAGADCAINSLYSKPSEDDLNLLLAKYEENPFGTIKNTTTEDLNGRSAIKYDISIDDNKLAEYASSLEELSMVKKLKECGDSYDDTYTEDLADGDTTPLTIWVDKSDKVISKVALASTQQDEEKENIKGNMEMTFSYGEASIEKPENAKPAIELFAELQAALYGGGTLGANTEDGVPVSGSAAPQGLLERLLQSQN